MRILLFLATNLGIMILLFGVSSLAEGYLALGDLYAKTGRDDEAEQMYKEVLRWEPGHLEATDHLKELRKGGGGLRGLFGGS